MAEAQAPQDGPREFTAARRFSADAAPTTRRRSAGSSDSIGTAFAKSFARQLGTKSGQALVRGVLGGIFKSR
jgi:uncharacterized protein